MKARATARLEQGVRRGGRRSNPQASVEDLVELLLDAGGRADRLTILRTVGR
jgi:hypothetical protein